jgi:hypothetical protein
MQVEIWKDIIGFEDRYQISNFGNVKSKEIILYLNRAEQKYPEITLKAEKTYRGYLRVMLAKDGVHKKVYIHRLVATHFINNPLNKEQVNHLNGVKIDNRVKNLEWATRSENMLHYYKNKPLLGVPSPSK